MTSCEAPKPLLPRCALTDACAGRPYPYSSKTEQARMQLRDKQTDEALLLLKGTDAGAWQEPAAALAVHRTLGARCCPARN